MKIFAISGSLRAASMNTAVLKAISRLSTGNITVEIYADLGQLPLFNPDVEIADSPFPANLRTQIMDSDAVLIASPEYAHGISGAMKNALDWMVGCEAFVNKPVVLLNTSPRAVHAQAALRETLSMMSANIVDAACATVPLLGSKLTVDEIVHHPIIQALLINVLEKIQTFVQSGRSLPDSLAINNGELDEK